MTTFRMKTLSISSQEGLVEVGHEGGDVGHLVLGGQDGAAEVVGAGHLSEAAAGHQHDAGVVQQLRAVQHVCLDALGFCRSDCFGCTQT
jgi:hypothetical protein